MKPSPAKSRFDGKSLWIVLLIALLVVTIGWFADPLGKIEGSPAPQPVADPTEWTVAPSGPAVDVTLPQTILKGNPNGEPENGK